MKKKVILLLILVLIIGILSSCVYLKERILNNEPLYGGGNIKNNSNVNFVSDLGLYSYIENFNKVDDTLSIVSTSLPSSFDKFDYSIETLSQNIVFDSSDKYSLLKGITTYKGNNYRNSSSYGYPVITNKKLNLLWTFSTSNIDNFKGVGWTGQASIVHWPFDTQQVMNLYHSYKKSNGTIEVIYGSLDGHIYFIDLYTGKPTRNAINLGLPIFGSITIDPRGYPLLYVGTGFNQNGQRYEEMSFFIISLIDGEILYEITSIDDKAVRAWNAFDSAPLIDKESDTLIIGCEDGILYNIKLNSEFDIDNKSITINPNITKYYYTNPFGKTVGFESSLAAYKNYLFISDNGGLLQCIDSTNFSPVWLYDLKDDSDSTISLEVINDDTVHLYTATEVVYEKDESFSFIRKLNALTGQLIWETKYKCFYSDDFTTGITSTPIVGLSDISNIVIYSITGLGEKGINSSLLSIDKLTGDIKWQNDNSPYTISSPVAIYDENGISYIINSYSNGVIELIKGTTGVILNSIQLDGAIEGTPAIYNGMLVIGTRSGNIYNIRIN